jgi:hypothetical protein
MPRERTSLARSLDVCSRCSKSGIRTSSFLRMLLLERVAARLVIVMFPIVVEGN